MIRLIILTLSCILVLVGSARSEQLYLNCKWDNGKVSDEKPVTKIEPGSKDSSVVLDLSEKKIIKSPLGRQVKVELWTNESIVWSKEDKQNQYNVSYNLNRNSGFLKENYFDEKMRVQIINNYYCTKA